MKLRLSQLFIASAAAVSFSVIAAGQQDRQAQQPATPSTGASASQQQSGAAAGASQSGASEQRGSASGGATQQPGASAAAGASEKRDSAAGGASQPMGQQHDQQTIRKVQEKLTEKGHQVQVDGMMGPETQQALKEFQKKEGIQETGQLDKQTLSALGVEETGAAAGAGAPASGAPASGATTPGAQQSDRAPGQTGQQPGQTQKKY